MKVDLHVHSKYSPDAISTPQSILKIAEKKGIDAVAITDHETIVGWKEMIAVATRFSVKVILGQEIKVHQQGKVIGEVLCLFLKQPILNRGFEEVMTEVCAQGGILSLAHPFDHGRLSFRGLEALPNLREIAIEVFNSRTYKFRGKDEAFRFAEKYELMITAGSDAHTPQEVGNAYLESEANNLQEFKQALKEKQVTVVGKRSSPFLSLYSGLGHFGYAR